jgi:UDP-N-acetylmuramate--alanine ligase
LTGYNLLELEKGETAHLVGIGGAGMSAIATVLLQMGYRVEGSDLKESPNVRRLRQLGAVVGLGHRADNLGSARVVIRSSAVLGDNPELVEAERLGIPVISRAQMLSAIMATRKGIAVAGTHGKTTTSSLVTQVLLDCGADPSFLIGGELNEIGSNAHYGEGEYLVAESDESDGSLLCLRPWCAVLTNVDLDHTDYFENIEQVESIFGEFLRLLPADGFAVVCGDDPRAREVGVGFRSDGGKVFFYGRSPENDYVFRDASTGAEGCDYTALFDGSSLGKVHTRIPGMHNVYNSLAALAVAHRLGLPKEPALDGLKRFQGVRRRFELIGIHDGIRVIDDYAHHPTEVKAVLDLAAGLEPSRVVAVFQPHRYTRTGKLAGDFGPSFEGADLVVVTDVYGAGEEPEPGVSGRLVADSIRERYPAKQLFYVASRGELAASVVPLLRQGDMVITMGAGDVTQCAREILEILAESSR